MKLKTRIVLGLALLFALVWMWGELQPAGALEKEDLQRGLRAAVKLGILGPDDEVMGTCSGTILDNTGVILTNFHCVGQTDLYGPDEDFGLSHGELWHPNGILIVAINNDPRKLPVPTYLAQFVTGNPNQDVAVIKIVADIDGSTELPQNLPLVPAVLADSDTVDIGDEVTVIGYPGVGGDTVTLTDGKIAGFLDEDEDDLTDWLKTDALINGGNSGGSAVNEGGEVIGIPSASLFEEGRGDEMYFIKPLNQAVPIITRAKRAGSAGGEIGSGGKGENVSGDIPAGQNFGELAFGTGFDDGVTGESKTFESGLSEIYAELPYQDMRNGTNWGYIWQYEGQDVVGETDLRWEFGKSGVLDLSLTHEEGLPDGEYNLRIVLRDKVIQEAGFVIGSSDPTDQPDKPPAEEETDVWVGGYIVDYDTQRPIEGAVIAFLLPDKTVEDFDDSEDMSTVLSLGITDANGMYIAETPLPRGESYTVIAGKKGYQRLAVDFGLDVPEDVSDFLELYPIELEQE